MKHKLNHKQKLKLDTLLKLRQKALFGSVKYGRLFDSPEDAANEYVARLLEGLHNKATIHQALTDMARKKGDPRRKYYKEQINVSFTVPIELKKLQLDYDPTDIIENRIMIRQLFEKLTTQQKTVIFLFLEGHTYLEIGKQMKLSAARIQQIHDKSIRQMKKSLN